MPRYEVCVQGSYEVEAANEEEAEEKAMSQILDDPGLLSFDVQLCDEEEEDDEEEEGEE